MGSLRHMAIVALSAPQGALYIMMRYLDLATFQIFAQPTKIFIHLYARVPQQLLRITTTLLMHLRELRKCDNV